MNSYKKLHLCITQQPVILKYIILSLISCYIFLVPLFQRQSNFDKIKIKNDSLIYYKSVTDKIQSEIEYLKLNQIQLDIRSIGLPKLDSEDQLI